MTNSLKTLEPAGWRKRIACEANGQQQAATKRAAMRQALLSAEVWLLQYGWVQGREAVGAAGEPVDIMSSNARRCCLQGALIRANADQPDLAFVELFRALNQHVAQNPNIQGQTLFEFNDDPATTLADVCQVLQSVADDFS